MKTRGMIRLLACCMVMPLLELSGQESIAEPLERIMELRMEVAHHDELYFRQASPEISDAVYDAMRRELEDLERAWPEAAARSRPLQAPVGDDRTGRFSESAHHVPMLSLNKSYAKGELLAFHANLVEQLKEEDLEYWIEPKVDGMAVSLVYEDGKLKRILSRGNGRVGEDLMEALRQVPGLPGEFNSSSDSPDEITPVLMELRGEIFVPWSEFKRTNAARELEGLPPYTSPRNMAVGLARSGELSGDLLAALRVVVFGLGAWEPLAGKPASYTQFRDLMRAWSIPVLDYAVLVQGPDDLLEAIGALGSSRDTWPFAADGVVVKLNSTRDRDRLGCDERAPRWAIAHKFPPDHAETTLRAITWQVGRTGVLSPVAELDPVNLMGRSMTRASLHNAAFIEDGDYRPGDTVLVKLAGDVIPILAGVVTKQGRPRGKPLALPGNCPDCGSELIRTGGSQILRCPNPDCRGSLLARIAHFCKCHGVRGMGESSLNQLIRGGHLSSLADLYELDQESLTGSGGYSIEEAKDLLEMIARSRGSPLDVQIQAAGLPGVGRVRARQLASQFADYAGFVRGFASQLEPLWRQRLEELAHWYL